MHYKQLLLFGIDHIQFDEISTLIESCREGLKSIFRKDRAKSTMRDIERTTLLVNVGSGIGFGGDSKHQTSSD